MPEPQVPSARLLILENMDGERGAISSDLEIPGVEIVPVLGPDDLAYRVHRERVDMAIISGVSPEFDPLQAIDKARAKMPPAAFIPILFAVALQDEEACEAALARGADDIIRIPLLQNVIKARIKSLLLSRRRAQDLAEALSKKAKAKEQFRNCIKTLNHRSPQNLPNGWTILSSIETAESFHGDYFDIFKISENELAISIADVLGKGPAALARIAASQAAIRMSLTTGASPGEALSTTNQVLIDQFENDCMMTLYLSVIDLSSGELRHATAGHDGAYLITGDGVTTPCSPETGGPPLGILTTDVEYGTCESEIPIGSRLILGTNGLWDHPGPEGKGMGVEAYQQILSKSASNKSAAGALEFIFKEVETFRGPLERKDDATLVLIERS